MHWPSFVSTNSPFKYAERPATRPLVTSHLQLTHAPPPFPPSSPNLHTCFRHTKHFFFDSHLLKSHFISLRIHSILSRQHFNTTIKMATREKLMRRLSALPAEDLLKLLSDDTIFEVARKFFDTPNTPYEDTKPMASTDASSSTVTSEPLASPSHERAKRPLNAFMAFRSEFYSSGQMCTH
jgi:hypothetical protein